jgi:hypothetical protein
MVKILVKIMKKIELQDKFGGRYQFMILTLMENEYSVYKFGTEYKINENIFNNKFVSITKTEDEISIVAPSNMLNDFIEVENNWKILKIEGILDFSLIGIVSRISTILANENISLFVLSTYNTDYIMVKAKKIKQAMDVLIENDYDIKIK